MLSVQLTRTIQETAGNRSQFVSMLHNIFCFTINTIPISTSITYAAYMPAWQDSEFSSIDSVVHYNVFTPVYEVNATFQHNYIEG